MNVALVCTTDDPLDSLEHHIRLKKMVLKFRYCLRFVPTRP
jgi:glucuronate isomerase